jgi:hypothetical protein
MSNQVTFTVSEDQLRTNPLVQAAAIAYLATDVKYTGDEGDADEFADRTAQAITDCCAAMGVVKIHLSATLSERRFGICRTRCVSCW